jgi:2,3-dihydroxybenzoate-AMP ligase
MAGNGHQITNHAQRFWIISGVLMMSIPFTPWPADLAQHYRQQGYWLDKPLTDILTRQQDNDAPALIDTHSQLSYRQLHHLSNNMAAALQRRGLHAGHTALVQLSNCVEFYVVFFALLKLGVVPVNALFNHQRNELMAYARQIQPRLLIADRQHPLFADNAFVDELRQQVTSLRTLVWQHDDSGLSSLSTLAHEDCGEFIATPSDAGQVAFFQLSGGSTGTPKLIPRTHNDYYYSIRQSVDVCRFSEHTRYLCALPIAHNYPMSSPGVLGVFYAAGCAVLAADPSPSSCFPLVARHQITVVALVPPAATLWLQALPQWPQPGCLDSLQLLQIGGAKVSPTLAKRLINEIGCQLQQVFGMAEGLVNYTGLDDDEAQIIGTQGRPMSPADEVWVADEEGKPLPIGQVGRLMTRGPYTFRGYYQSPAHNASVFDSQGFYCSGDLVYITSQGDLCVEGREKDQINRGGEKIAAEEIEDLLLRHPQVVNAALVSMPDTLMGEKSCAFVVASSPLNAVVLRRHLRAQGIAEYKLPDRFIQRNDLPLTAVGKVDKKILRQQVTQLATQEAQGETI